MAGAATDKFRKSFAFTSKTLSSGIDNSTTTIPLNNVTNIPTDTGVTIIIDRVDSNGVATPSAREVCTGVVSGTSIISATRGQQGTTAQTHALGAVVELQISAQIQNDLVDGLLIGHTQAGAHVSALPLTSPVLTTPKVVTSINDSNGNEVIKTPATSSATNEITVTNAANGAAPQISATGSSDTNVNLDLKGKGTGSVTTNGSKILSGLTNYVLSGGVWTADAAGSTRAASMTSGVVLINGNYLTVAVVTARTFTASKDTYVDLSDNADGTALITYTEVTNNAASPALAANSIRIATVVTGASNIAASTSIGQGGFANIVPVISSQIFKGFDSLGNIIYPKGPASPSLATNAYKFLTKRTAAANTGNGAFAVVAFDTEVFDTGSNVSAGVFTAPVAGYYQFNWSTHGTAASTGQTLFGSLFINGVEKSRGSRSVARGADVLGSTGATIIQLAATDTADIRAFGSATFPLDVGAPEYNNFSGFLVSAS